MKHRMAVVTWIALLGGCANGVSTQEATVAQGVATLSPAACADEQDQCFDRSPVLGILTCPLQYTECLATADDGLPAAVVSAAQSATDCAAALLDCELTAEAPSEVLACTEIAAMCVADVVGVSKLPMAASGTRDCVIASVDCVDQATRVGDLVACAETFQMCAIDEAAAVLPDGLGEVVSDVSTCQFELTDCVDRASTPTELARCGELDLACVADGIGVEVDVTLASDAVGCAESATLCIFDLSSAAEATACGEELVGCAEAPIVHAVDCEARWSACLLRSPLDFATCGQAYTDCASSR